MSILRESLSTNGVIKVYEGEDVTETRSIRINAVVRDERAKNILAVEYSPCCTVLEEADTYLCFRT